MYYEPLDFFPSFWDNGYMKKFAAKKPKVSETKWEQTFHNQGVTFYTSDTFFDYYKVVTNKDKKAKYFFGETAWMDAQRYAVDNSDFSAYNIFA